jgi:hypothetical protein
VDVIHYSYDIVLHIRDKSTLGGILAFCMLQTKRFGGLSAVSPMQVNNTAKQMKMTENHAQYTYGSCRERLLIGHCVYFRLHTNR